MIRDTHLFLSEAQAATEATGASTSTIDLTKAGDAVGGQELTLVVRVGTACASSGKGATLTIALQCHEDASFSTGTKTLASIAIAEANLTADTIVWRIKIPAGCEQFVRLYYTESGEAFTSGTLDAFLVNDADVDGLVIA